MAALTKKKNLIVAIDFAWSDPWTGEWCVGWRMAWSKQRAAMSYYSRQIRAMKVLAKQFTGLRTPKLRISIIRLEAK